MAAICGVRRIVYPHEIVRMRYVPPSMSTAGVAPSATHKPSGCTLVPPPPILHQRLLQLPGQQHVLLVAKIARLRPRVAALAARVGGGNPGRRQAIHLHALDIAPYGLHAFQWRLMNGPCWRALSGRAGRLISVSVVRVNEP